MPEITWIPTATVNDIRKAYHAWQFDDLAALAVKRSPLGWKSPQQTKRVKPKGKVRKNFEHLNLCNEQRVSKMKTRREALLIYVQANPECKAIDAQAFVIAVGHKGSISTILGDLRKMVDDGLLNMQHGSPRVPARYTVK